MKNYIKTIEEYVKETMSNSIAHDFKHVDRVRNWALHIAKKEGYKNLEVVEAAALLHDIGLVFCEDRKFHGQVGSEIAEKYLKENEYFTSKEIEDITNAIRYHNSNKDGSGELLMIIRDADMMDLFGAIGIMRAFTSKASKPEYNTENIKGDTWEASAKDFDRRFASGQGIGIYIIDQINFQMSCYDNMTTEGAKELAKPLIKYMKEYILQLEGEIGGSRELSIN